MKKAGKASKAKFVIPILASCLGLLVATLLMLPMLKMQPRDVPVAILSLDKGAKIDGEKVNVGDMIVGELTGQDYDRPEALEDVSLLGDSSEEGDDESENDGQTGYVSSDAVKWIIAENEEQIEGMLDSGECYAAMTIPKNFSKYVIENAGRTQIGAQLVEKLPDLASGANALSDGSSAIEDGSSALASGASKLSGGISKLQNGASALPSAAKSAANGASTLEGGLVKLKDGASSLKDGASSLEDGASKVDQAISAAMTALSSGSASSSQVLALLSAASQGASQLETGASKLADGASTLEKGLSSSAQGAKKLESGLGQLADSAPQLSSGISALGQGASSLGSGANALSEGASSLKDGTGTLAEGLDTANDALKDLPRGPDSSAIQLVINQGKNPMVSNSLGSAISGLGASSGMTFDISYINPLPSEMSMGFTHMILMILTYIASYATAAVIANVLKPKRGRVGKILASIGIQIVYACACALLIGFCGAAILIAATGADIAYVDLSLFIAMASFAFQMLVIGSLDLLGNVGMLVPIGLLVIGMGTAYLPTEFLPAFWQDWVYPWDPLRFMVDGYRGILYMGQGFWNASTPALLVMSAIGLVLMAARVALNRKGAKTNGEIGKKSKSRRSRSSRKATIPASSKGAIAKPQLRRQMLESKASSTQ